MIGDLLCRRTAACPCAIAATGARTSDVMPSPSAPIPSTAARRPAFAKAEKRENIIDKLSLFIILFNYAASWARVWPSEIIVASGNQNFTLARMVGRTDNALLFHAFDD